MKENKTATATNNTINNGKKEEKTMKENKLRKNMNLATIDTATLSILSDFVKARYDLSVLASNHKKELAKLNKSLKAQEKKQDDYLAQRDKDGKQLHTIDDAMAKYPTEKEHKAVNKENEAYKNACETPKKAIKDACDIISNDIYNSYVLSIINGDIKAKGKITLYKGKDKDKKEIIDVNESLFSSMTTFVIDVLKIDNCREDNFTKFCNCMVARVAGARVNNKRTDITSDFVTYKNASQFKRLFIEAFLQYAIIDKGVYVETEEHTLVVKDFTKQERGTK